MQNGSKMILHYMKEKKRKQDSTHHVHFKSSLTPDNEFQEVKHTHTHTYRLIKNLPKSVVPVTSRYLQDHILA